MDHRAWAVRRVTYLPVWRSGRSCRWRWVEGFHASRWWKPRLDAFAREVFGPACCLPPAGTAPQPTQVAGSCYSTMVQPDQSAALFVLAEQKPATRSVPADRLRSGYSRSHRCPRAGWRRCPAAHRKPPLTSAVQDARFRATLPGVPGPWWLSLPPRCSPQSL